MSLGQKFLDAMEILATSSVEKAGYDKTIQAQILSCEDATIGKYRCRYQDAIFYAYSNNSDITFTNGSYVYILVPGNDMGKEKTILGTTKKLGINYISQAEGDQAYDIIGVNCITSDNTYYLDTNNKNYKYVIYQFGNAFDVNLDIVSLEQNIKDSSSVIVGATFQTSIPPKRQYRGHYGITYNLRFLDNTSNTEVIRSYTVDEDTMIDNPYRLAYDTRQYQIFDIDGPNFIRVESIEIFNQDFPEAIGQQTNKKLQSGDIKITKLELTGAVRMSESEVNGIAISFYTPQGNFFSDDVSNEESYKTIVAQVRVKGKLVSASQNIPFYWGSENVGITPNSQYYNRYLGRGWKCLNDNNVIQTVMVPIDITEIMYINKKADDDENYYFKNQFKVYTVTTDGDENKNYRLMTLEDYQHIAQLDLAYQKNNVVEWVPSKDTFILKLSQATARNNKIKVAIFYDGTVVTKEITIYNLAAIAPVLTIESSGGTKFYYDIGHPTLTCKVEAEGVEQEPSNYTYYWAYQSNTGALEELPETDDINTDYDNAVQKLNNLKAEIANGTKFVNAEADNLTKAEKAVKAFDSTQRVKGNKIYDVQINRITSSGIFKCSVYNDKGIYLGTASITLTNTLDGEGLYSLVINNGSASFQYNEDGIAPNSKTLDIQQQIQALTFTIYDNLGQPIDDDIIAKEKNCEIRWQIPIKETLLVNKYEGQQSAGTDATQTYQYYDNMTNFIYGIAQRYDIKKQNNQIKLTVNYKGMNLTAATDFTFVKQGEPGTNGTNYIVKLVPNTKMSNPPLYPMVTTTKTLEGNQIYKLNYGLGTDATEKIINKDADQKLLKAQLWRDGELIWEGFSNADTAEDNISKPALVHWEILKNKYNSVKNENGEIVDVQDASAFKIANDTNAGKGLIRYTGDHLVNAIETPLANIVKCSIDWQGKTYYGTIPVTTAWTINENYKVSLKDYTGFRYVLYTADGVNPQYDNSHPFEFICQQKINNIWEDISLVQGNHIISDYEVNGIGEMDGDPILTILSNAHRDGLEKNQWQARPISRYNGECVNAAITCIYKRRDELNNETIIGRINVPIHFLLNKYGLSHINDWDGNSVQVNQEGGYILSPQMGAGEKDDNNNFTGVLMGEVKEAGKSKSDIGLLGYSGGARTFFLNSKNGSAIFGKSGGGQIIIDPSTQADQIKVNDETIEVPRNKALLYSSAFWKNYNENGLPKNYHSTNEKGQGLLIDLTTPEIRYGNGNFYVTKDGYLHASGGGKIAGWNIKDSTLTSSSGNITLDSTGKIYSNSHTSLTNTKDGFFLSASGLSIGSKFKVNNTGQVYIGTGAVANTGSHWIIDGNDDRSYIAYGGNSMPTITGATKKKDGTAISDIAQVYIGTDGISLGNRFKITNEGYLTAYRGTIGGWTIDTNKLTGGDLTLKSEGSISGGNSKYKIETKNSKGKVISTTTADYSWSIDKDGKAIFNNLTANKNGSIGGWTINSTNLYANDGKGHYLKLNNDGSITSTNWSIGSDGAAYFNKSLSISSTFSLTGAGTISGGGSLGGTGMRLGSGEVGSYINPGTVTDQNGTKLDEVFASYAEFDTLKTKVANIDTLTIEDVFNYRGRYGGWSPVIYSLSISGSRKDGNLTSITITAHKVKALTAGVTDSSSYSL